MKIPAFLSSAITGNRRLTSYAYTYSSLCNAPLPIHPFIPSPLPSRHRKFTVTLNVPTMRCIDKRRKKEREKEKKGEEKIETDR